MSNAQSTRKVLWLNPLGYQAYDQPMADYMKEIKKSGTYVEVASLQMENSPNHLGYRTYEALMIGDTVRVARYASENNFDAMVIGCFYDPGIEDAREISGDTIVIAPCQASVQIAANLCNKFSVIVGEQKWVEQMTERVHTYGYGNWLASMRSIELGANQLQDDCDLTIDRIIKAGRKAIEEDHAEALILGCTCNFGLFTEIQNELGVPVIDPIVAAFKMAEHFSELKRDFNWVPSRIGSFAPPPEGELESFGIFKSDVPIGNSVIVE